VLAAYTVPTIAAFDSTLLVRVGSIFKNKEAAGAMQLQLPATSSILKTVVEL